MLSRTKGRQAQWHMPVIPALRRQKQEEAGTSETAQRVKALTTEADNLSMIPRNPGKVEGESQPHKLSFGLHMGAVPCAYHTNK